MARFDVRPDIDAAAGRLSNTMGAQREITELPQILREGETVDTLASGQYGGGAGLLAMTDRRLVFLEHGATARRVAEFAYGSISSVRWQGGMIFGTLTVLAAGSQAEINQIPKQDGRALADRLRSRVAQETAPAGQAAPAAPHAPAAVPAAGGQDVATRLATLEQLRAVGAVTDAEYRDRRAAILDGP